MAEALNDQDLDRGDDQSRDLIKSLAKGIAVMRAFSVHRTPLTMTAVAEIVGLSRPAVRRILLTLEDLGYAHQHRGQWSLTPRVLEIGAGYFSKNSLPEIAGPFLQILADRVQETCHVAVWDRFEVVHVARVEVQRVVPDPMYVGTRLPANATALGQVLLTGLNDAELDEYLKKTDRVAYTPGTIVDRRELRSRVKKVREQGFAITTDELVLGTTGVAVPIISAGHVVGALGATTSPLRSTNESLRESFVPALGEISAEIAQAYDLSNRRLPRAVSGGT
jgi:IclR family pca regulon transcriptional regulator